MAAASLTGSGLPEPVAAAMPALADGLSAAFAARLVGLVLYGSAVRGGWRVGASDVNLLVVLDEVRAADIELVGRHCAKLKGLAPTPVLMTPADFKVQAATRPAAIWDLAEAHLLLGGDDPCAGLRLNLLQLHRQMRADLRELLLRARAEYPTAGRALGSLISRVFGAALHLLRGSLRLFGRPADADPVTTIGELARTLGLDLPTLQRLYALRYGGEPVRPAEAVALFDRLLALIEAAADKVDRVDLQARRAEAEKAKQPPAEPEPEPEPEPSADGQLTIPETTDEAAAAELSPDPADEPESTTDPAPVAEADPASAPEPEA